jgi:fatty acid desaturase
MLRAAAEIARDLHKARPVIYWGDTVASVVIGYGALALAITLASPGLALLAAFVSVLALYRAGSFIHEITHMKHGCAGLSAGLEPAGRRAADGPVVHV